MIGLDTNVLVSAIVSSHPDHTQAMSWLDQRTELLATTQVNTAELLRLVTHPRVFHRPMDLVTASRVLEGFCEAYDLEILTSEERWWRHLLRDTFQGTTLRGNDIFDLQIALCLEHHGVRQICTRDSGFARFGFLEVIGF